MLGFASLPPKFLPSRLDRPDDGGPNVTKVSNQSSGLEELKLMLVAGNRFCSAVKENLSQRIC
ncbi:unnamed protein product [Citrullus colocynthis]|uniref:Uncharacterized protein n=1 Tax=Citrullus colocynthis TaxID=252529 RepID=A0ABP0XYS9_9ROSI